MDNRQQTFQFENAFAEAFQFDNNTAVKEYHVMIHVNSSRLPYTTQLEAVMNAYNSLIDGPLKGAQAVFKRYFLSDAANQADEIIVSDVTDCAKMFRRDSRQADSMKCVTVTSDTSGTVLPIIWRPIQNTRHVCSSTSITCSSSRKDVRWKPTVSAPGFSSTTWT